MNKIILTGLFLFTLLSCGEHKEDTYQDFDFTITEKISLKNNKGGYDYFFKSKDSIMEVSTLAYAQYDVGHTFKYRRITSGLMKGMVYSRE
ncbi:hypothetical protein RIU21_07300 [Riemerella anatipestifer]|uniref:hypothetical protein n=1 Tax=Riemerella anatipestifer TaxID=34085 RepID=UPI00285F7114|nr:hypothetical protein [Riemerella anatipestifer]MDR7846571.1 hypothetical protein [Riemerella anatipestifer]